MTAGFEKYTLEDGAPSWQCATRPVSSSLCSPHLTRACPCPRLLQVRTDVRSGRLRVVGCWTQDSSLIKAAYARFKDKKAKINEFRLSGLLSAQTTPNKVPERRELHINSRGASLKRRRGAWRWWCQECSRFLAVGWQVRAQDFPVESFPRDPLLTNLSSCGPRLMGTAL